MPLVDQHLAPVLDQEITMLRSQILEERAAEKRAAPARHARPLTVGAVEALEGFRLLRTRVELPDYSNHERPPPGCSAVYQGFAAPRSLTVAAHVLRRPRRRSEEHNPRHFHSADARIRGRDP